MSDHEEHRKAFEDLFGVDLWADCVALYGSEDAAWKAVSDHIAAHLEMVDNWRSINDSGVIDRLAEEVKR